ncbi:hypothetical protein L486_02362 [Kwoniella mangroviensis CBS 10435]|uniref:Opioid growth factor receptor (OGFr) conserved domain-containing protein n=1 Tax=Kwoniella mangroviensis CBS 10435 TaxID=1331196 RepID=A0A1B9IVX6_9TREE|nr:hypothetical protein L486_02362 [Kwoniella mangroviensis CBS 10435]
MPRPRDIDLFLSSYAGQGSTSLGDRNYQFYSNQISCQPDGLKYQEWMKRYENDMIELEMNHGYVQWFFPIRERGVNPLAQPLTIDEIDKMKVDETIQDRLLRSYKMMLSFYGIDFNNGKLQISKDHRERFRNLRDHSHNLLRLTRILKHLSEFPQLQPHAASLVLFFTAVHSEGLLNFEEGSMRGNSLDQWWSNCFRDESERKTIRSIVRNRGGFGEKNWGWNEFEKWYDARESNGKE